MIRESSQDCSILPQDGEKGKQPELEYAYADAGTYTASILLANPVVSHTTFYFSLNVPFFHWLV